MIAAAVPDPTSTAAWIAFGSALAGAVVGGAASLIGSIVVDRVRLRRETRFRIYDDYIGDAAAAVARWETRSSQGNLDLEHNAALLAVAQVRRAAVIAGKADQRQVKTWEADYLALCELSKEIHRLPAVGSGTFDPKERDRLLRQVITHIGPVMRGLSDYLDWLEKRLS